MPTPKYDRPELRPDREVPHPRKPQPQPTPAFRPGSGGGNNGR